MASIRERNGKFNVIYSYTDADGKRKQKWETYATKAEAQKDEKDIEKEMVKLMETSEELASNYQILISFKGIGPITAAAGMIQA